MVKATRGMIPRMKWRTQEKKSALGDVLETSAVKPAQHGAIRPRGGVGLPWTSTNNLDVSRYRFGDIEDMVSRLETVVTRAGL
jgi:hypothetical protein